MLEVKNIAQIQIRKCDYNRMVGSLVKEKEKRLLYYSKEEYSLRLQTNCKRIQYGFELWLTMAYL